MARKKVQLDDFEKSTKKYMNEIGNLSPLTKTEEEKLWKQYKYEGNINAKNKLITSNLRFVAKIANLYRGRGLAYSDLIEEGNMGLIKSLDYFDEKKGNRVLSYAVWWIKQMMIEAIDKRNGIGGEELPEDYDLYSEEDSLCGNKGGKTMTNIPVYEEPENDEEKKETIEDMLSILNEREKDMIIMYYGLNNEKPCTLEEIGNEYGLTKERVRQINEKSLKKIRSYALSKNIQADIYNK